jgi:hypothetical protein
MELAKIHILLIVFCSFLRLPLTKVYRHVLSRAAPVDLLYLQPLICWSSTKRMRLVLVRLWLKNINHTHSFTYLERLRNIKSKTYIGKKEQFVPRCGVVFENLTTSIGDLMIAN